jgi:CPA2 family monovalent cation:H+ antiporter-2
MAEWGLLRDLAIVLVAALGAGVVSLRLKQPVLVGYLIGGMLIGPHGLGIITDEVSIGHLASIGVIMLMFALGVEFSLAQFRSLRWAVLGGGGLYIALMTVLGGFTMAFTQQPLGLAVLIGFAVALSSTIIVMRVLMDRQEISSIHGRVMLGWLILQDLAVVPMLVVLPFLTDSGGGIGWPMGLALAKVAVFLILMYALGTRLFPPLLRRLAYLRHKEIFFLGVIALCFGTAALSQAFGLSLALGAFLAGLVISQSDEQRQVLAEVLPLRDLFVTVFFVSVGMLIDPAFVVTHHALLAGLVVAIMAGKAITGTAIAAVFRLSRRASLLVGLGLAQIGEFSFVLASEGQRQGLLGADTFSLILSAALVTMLLTPMAMQASAPLSRLVARLYHTHDRGPHDPDLGPEACALRDHVVIVGWGRVASHLGRILHRRGVPLLVVDLDRRLLGKLEEAGIRTLYGDAAMREVIAHAELPCARLLILALPDPATSLLVVEHAKAINPSLEVVVRVQRTEDMATFRALGVTEVLQPEFEAAIAMIRTALARLDWPPHVVHAHLARLRHSGFEGLHQDQEDGYLEDMMAPPIGSETAWFNLPPGSAIAGLSLGQADLPGRTGVQVLVHKRLEAHRVHPDDGCRLDAGDSLLVLGTPEQLETVVRLVQPANQDALASWDGQGGRLAGVSEEPAVTITRWPDGQQPSAREDVP